VAIASGSGDSSNRVGGHGRSSDYSAAVHLTILTFLAVALADWANERQQHAIEYLREEDRVLQEKLGGRRTLPSDDQRRWLAFKRNRLGRRFLGKACKIVSPNMILRWHHQLIARSTTAGPGAGAAAPAACARSGSCACGWRPRTRIGDKPGYNGRSPTSAIASTARPSGASCEHGLKPAPRRYMPWGAFPRAHWEAIAAVDFLKVEAWTLRGLNRFYVFFVLDLETQCVRIAGITDRPCAEWVTRVTRSLIDDFDGCLGKHRFLIHDPAPLFRGGFPALLRSAGVEPVRLPPQSPNLNAYAERFVRSIKDECLSTIVPIGERHLRHTIDEYIVHYHVSRNHQDLGNRLIDGEAEAKLVDLVVCHGCLGGTLRSYHCAPPSHRYSQETPRPT
jgi:transposase InsO family protein